MAGYDAIVIGGGVVGLSTAYHLVRDGARTLLIDRGDRGRATDAGAGILSTATSIDDAGPIERFEARAAQYYPILIEALRAEGAGDTGYGVTGSLTVAVSDDEVAPFERVRTSLLRWGGLATGGYAEVSPERARALFPPLGRVQGAIHCSRGARVDGRRLAAALRSAAQARGLVLREADVSRLIRSAGTIQGVRVGGEEIEAGHVVVAAGAWSDAFSEQLGARIVVEPQRGQIVHLRLPEIDTGAWPIVIAFRGHYMVPWPDGRVVVGATRETGSGFRSQNTIAGIVQVLGEALRVAPGLKDASLQEIRVGLRPASADGLPILGPVRGAANVLLATGHGSVGLQLGPYSGKLIAEFITRGAPSTDIATFNVARFA
jgi:D-amino-acid dehydrogenase